MFSYCILLFFFFFFYCSAAVRDLHSFPTRRSSDLRVSCCQPPASSITFRRHTPAVPLKLKNAPRRDRAPCSTRSEEHTSELQSRQYLVCRLLLEKKKKKNKELHSNLNMIITLDTAS